MTGDLGSNKSTLEVSHPLPTSSPAPSRNLGITHTPQQADLIETKMSNEQGNAAFTKVSKRGRETRKERYKREK